jgi:protein-S-isoprenylcysteine O-methyltransferase Ste14
MSMALKCVLFAVISAALLGVFWNALRRGWTHALPRLIAFEALLALVIANAAHWFEEPLSMRQVISWVVLIGSLLLALHGFVLLRSQGAPTAGIESTTVVVRRGAYRWIRHPLYLSLMLFAVGAFLKWPGVLSAILLGVALASLLGTAGLEEKENLQRFGGAYREYMRDTKRFIPFVY